MTNITQNNTPANQRPANQIADNSLSLQELWYLSLDNWKWFVLSTVLCLCVASYYLLTTQKTYTRYASIMLKEESKGKSINSDVARAFGNMGMTRTDANIVNELKVITSKDMARSVSKRLALNIDYYVSGTFRESTLYGNTLPIKVEFPGCQDNDYITLDIDLKGDGKVELSNFSKNGESFDQSVTATVGYNVAKTPIGRVVVLKSHNYTNKASEKTIHVRRIAYDSARDMFLARFNAEMTDKMGTVIGMTYFDVSPQRAEDVLNTVIAIYNENWIKDKNQIALSTSEFIDERLQVIEKELGHVDTDISSYKSAHQITDLRAEGSLYVQQTKETDALLLNLNSQLYMARNIRSYIANGSKPYQLLPANTGLSNSNIEALIKDFNSRVLQRNNLVANSSERSPIVIEMDAQLDNLHLSLLSGIDNEIKNLETQIGAQRGFANQATAKITSNPNQQKHLLSFERQQKVKESLYLFLLQKREENELSQAFTAYNTRVIDKPQGSRRPTSPVTNKVLLIALALGICIPLAFLYLREMLNTTIRSKNDINDKLTMPFIGEIPTYTKNIPAKPYEFWKKTQHRDIVVRGGNRGIMNEAFRLVGTNLEFMANADGRDNVYMITSYNPGSGKSFIGANIGATFALKNKKVLIIDGDLRHASTSQIVKMPELGISDYLSGKVKDVRNLIVKAGNFENLHILPVGTIPPNPTELLALPIFGELIEELRKDYDYIFIDCPPADMMADATIISKHVDRTIFIIRIGLFERKFISRLEEDYKNNKFNNLSLILNGITANNSRYGNKYGYTTYGYAYVNDDE